MNPDKEEVLAAETIAQATSRVEIVAEDLKFILKVRLNGKGDFGGTEK